MLAAFLQACRRRRASAARLLDELEQIASAARGQPDPRARKLLEWIRAEMQPGGKWNECAC